MISNRPTRIKSAAFLRSKGYLEQQFPEDIPDKQLFISDSPFAQSRFTIGKPCEIAPQSRKKNSCSKFHSARASLSITSEIWRRIHTTRSQSQLRSMQGRRKDQEPVRINLLEKVDRLKRKNKQRQQQYRKCLKAISRKTIEHARHIKDQGQLGNLQKQIRQLLIPFEKNKHLFEQRYKYRLLKIAQA